MAFPNNAVLDDFNRTDGRPITGWGDQIGGANDGTLTIASNVLSVFGNGTGRPSTAYWSAGTFNESQEVYATIGTVMGNGGQMELYGRIQNIGSSWSCYGLYCYKESGTNDDYFQVFKIVSGTPTQLGANMGISAEFGSGDKVGMTLVGSTIEVYRMPSGGSWASVGTRTDSSITGAGYIGAGIWFSTPKWDDFGGGNYSAVTLDSCLPDADVTTTGWTTTPLYSKINDSSDATVIQATAS